MNPLPFIVILSGVQGDTRRYRAFHLWQQLKIAGLNCVVDHITSPKSILFAEQADILILQRVTWDRTASQIIQHARKKNTLILADVDDLIFLPQSYQWIDSPDFNDKIRLKLYQENLQRNQITLSHCDAILVSTEFLADQVRQMQKPVWVHRNGFSIEMLKIAEDIYQSEKPVNLPLTLGYASGTPTHDRDFAQIKPVLQKLLTEFPDLRLHIVGHLNPGKDWGKLQEQVRHLPFVPWQKLPYTLHQFSINLAPLRLDNPFSQSKSEIKYMEAALLGIPTVASPTQAFRKAISSGENGFLASDSEEWETTLRLLVEDPQLRTQIGQRALTETIRQYSPWKRAGEIIRTLNQAIELFNPSIGSLPIPPIQQPHTVDHHNYLIDFQLENHPTLTERGWYSMRSRGIKTLLQEFWVFFRRLISPILPFR